MTFNPVSRFPRWSLLLFGAGLLLFFSERCAEYGDVMNSFFAEGLPRTHYEMEDLTFDSEGRGYLCGAVHEEDGFRQKKFDLCFKGVVFVAEDGGRSWVPEQLGRGVVTHAFFVGNSLFCVKRTYLRDIFATDKTILMERSGPGRWEEISTLDMMVRDIHVLEDSSILAVGILGHGQDSLANIMFSADMGQTWKTLLAGVHSSRSAICDGWLILDRTYLEGDDDYLLAVDMDDGSRERVSLGGSYSVRQMKSDGQTIWVLGKEDGFPTLYELDPKTKRPLLRYRFERPDEFPANLDVAEQKVSIALGTKKGHFVSYRHVLSVDKGETWVSRDLSGLSTCEPQDIMKDGTVKMFAGAGRMIFLEPPGR